MYVPPAFQVEDRGTLYDFIERYSFATLVSQVDGAPFATHLPVLLDREREVLLAHVARANPQWREFEGEALVMFQGPHAYVSPTWYAAELAVPTWNYAAVHVYGRPQLIEAEERVIGLLNRMVGVYEAGRPEPWPNALPDDFRRKLVRAIVAFEIPIARIEGKFKLGQNRPAEDRAGMVAALREGDAGARELAAFIEGQVSGEW